MGKNWLDMITELSAEVKVLRAGAPDVMKEFSAMARAASGAEALDAKTKELIALAISVAVRCDFCIAFYAQAAVKQGASRDEVMDGNGDLYGCRTLGHVCLAGYRNLRPV
jgi:AhpD family alkylhydroperoxidase